MQYYTNIAFIWGRYKDILTWKKYIDWGRRSRSIYFFGSIYPVLTSYKGYICYIINFRPCLYQNRHLGLLELYRYYIVSLTITTYYLLCHLLFFWHLMYLKIFFRQIIDHRYHLFQNVKQYPKIHYMTSQSISVFRYSKNNRAICFLPVNMLFAIRRFLSTFENIV